MSETLTRRNTLYSFGAGALALATGSTPKEGSEPKEAAGGPVAYTLAPLPYAYNALEPVLSEQILRIHHGKHHAGYVKKLNGALHELAAARATGDLSAIKALSRALAFAGSGHVLHALYWNSMTPGAGVEPEGALAEALERDFGSKDAFGAQFAAAAKKAEGSGWAVLGFEPMGKRLLVLQAEKHQNLTIWGIVPILVCDVWEHAYYPQYQNRRSDYVDAFMTLVDWKAVSGRLAEATG